MSQQAISTHAIPDITISPARAEKGDFSDPLLTDGKRPVARCADHWRYASLSAIDRPGVRVIVIAISLSMQEWL